MRANFGCFSLSIMYVRSEILPQAWHLKNSQISIRKRKCSAHLISAIGGINTPLRKIFINLGVCPWDIGVSIGGWYRPSWVVHIASPWKHRDTDPPASLIWGISFFYVQLGEESHNEWGEEGVAIHIKHMAELGPYIFQDARTVSHFLHLPPTTDKIPYRNRFREGLLIVFK